MKRARTLITPPLKWQQMIVATVPPPLIPVLAEQRQQRLAFETRRDYCVGQDLLLSKSAHLLCPAAFRNYLYNTGSHRLLHPATVLNCPSLA
jgi:hypothetical protein